MKFAYLKRPYQEKSWVIHMPTGYWYELGNGTSCGTDRDRYARVAEDLHAGFLHYTPALRALLLAPAFTMRLIDAEK